MLGIIGGTGLTQLEGLTVEKRKWYETPFGQPSDAVAVGNLNGCDIAFLARHGDPHQIPPHLINYRANIHALKQAGVTKIVAVNAVGGIHDRLGPAQIAIPDQIIDYTYGREHTIYDGINNPLEHIDFTYPYTEVLREELVSAARLSGVEVLDQGTYGATQGPRLETAAEVKRAKRDGCDMIGMTGMPEASLAREMGVDYACVALSVNWCAGMTESIITIDEIHEAIDLGMGAVKQILVNLVTNT